MPLICLYCRCILRYADLLLNQFDSLLYDDRNDPVNDRQRYIDFKVTVCRPAMIFPAAVISTTATDECKRCSLDQSDKGVTKVKVMQLRLLPEESLFEKYRLALRP